MYCPRCNRSLNESSFACGNCGWVKPGYYIAQVDDYSLTLYSVPSEDKNMISAMTNDVDSATMTIYINPSASENEPCTDINPIIHDAVEFFLHKHFATITDVQHGLRIGYLEAHQVIAQMENLGFIRSSDAMGTFEILISQKQWSKMYMFNPTSSAVSDKQLAEHQTNVLPQSKILNRLFRR